MMDLGQMIRDEMKRNPISEEERLKRVSKGERDMISIKKEHKKALNFNGLNYFTKKVKRAKIYSKDNFLNDITERSVGVLSLDNPDKFKEVLSLAYDEMSEHSKVYLLDKHIVFTTMYAVRGLYQDRYLNNINDSDDNSEKRICYKMSSSIQNKMDRRIKDGLMHRVILEKILKKHFKQFKFNLSDKKTDWNGLEFPTAVVGGFGERTTYKNLKYDLDEQFHSLKNTYFSAISVYFIEIRRIKQVYSYKKMFLKETTKFDRETIINLEKGFEDLKNKEYE